MSRHRIQKASRDHDRICSLIQDELEERGFKVHDHYEYKRNKYDNQVCGEVDLIAYKHGYNRAITVEVKYRHSPDNERKAIGQLKRSEKYCPLLKQFSNISKMYAYHVQDHRKYRLKIEK